MGFELAMHEITLVLFTTLAPAAMLTCSLLSLLVGFGRLGEEPRSRLAHCMVIPLVLAMVGLIASATHLGTPANALYVLTGVGRSPLSNEVACSVAFLVLCGLHWLYSYSLRVVRWLQRVWCAAVAASGLVAVASIAVAYGEPTIVTWAHPLVPAALVTAAVGGAPLLGALTLRVARVDLSRPAVMALVACGVAGVLGAVACMSLWWGSMAGVHNAVGPLAERVPMYPAMVAAYGACALAAYGIAGPRMVRAARGGASVATSRLVLGCALYFAGLFAVRFGFYMAHMTVGISL